MQWERKSQYTQISNTSPAYTVARFADGKARTFRASFKGTFLGDGCAKADAARQVCERHHQANQEAQEISHESSTGA